ncbi:MAG: diguanylate cyclase [Gemmataceae bacterium]
MRILVAEDDNVSRRLLSVTLGKWGYEAVAVADGQAAWQVLEEAESPSLAILDWMMPGKDGVQICRALRQRPDKPYVYLILLTAKDRKQDVIEGLEAGADDYLVKPFDAYELKARLSVGCRILALQRQLLDTCDRMRDQAKRDALTGLYNYGAILEILDREFDHIKGNPTSLGVIMADIDHFKRINDTLGHQAGDVVLRAIGRELSRVTRGRDTVGRYGGEEFLLVCPACLPCELRNLAERLRAQVGSLEVLHRDKTIQVTISVGATLAAGDEMRDLDAVVKEADDALYRAKKGGRNRVELSEIAARLGSSALKTAPPALVLDKVPLLS